MVRIVFGFISVCVVWIKISDFKKKPYNANGGKNYSGQNSGGYSRGGENQRWNSGSFDSQNPKAKIIYVNDQIKAPTIMIIDDEKKNLWTFPRRVALEMAEQAWLDLVQMSYDPDKINDLALKLKKAEEFLTSWTSVKISIKLKWREKMYADKALEKIEYAKEQLSKFGRVQYDTPKKEAQWYSIILFAK